MLWLVLYSAKVKQHATQNLGPKFDGKHIQHKHSHISLGKKVLLHIEGHVRIVYINRLCNYFVKEHTHKNSVHLCVCIHTYTYTYI